MRDKHNILGLGLLLFISESLVMFSVPYLNVLANVWIGLLLDVTMTSMMVVFVTVFWLRLNFNASPSQLTIVAAKTSAVILIAETGLMLAANYMSWALALWQEALLDGILFAVMTGPIIYHWAIKPFICEHPAPAPSLPILTCGIMTFAVLMFDLALPLGVASGVPYVMLVLIGLWFSNRNAPLVLASLGTALTIIGYYISESGGIHWMVLANRSLAVFAIWVTAILVMKYKKKEDELYHQRAQLEEALISEKKYSALQQQFVSLVSHEFRTPLTIIDGTAQRILRLKDEITPGQLVVRCEKIRFAVERMVGLIETTLYVSRLDAGKIKMCIQSCNIRSLIEEVCAHQSEISSSHDIRLDLGGVSENIDADCTLLGHIFTNMLSNAVKYSPDSPLIQVTGWLDSGMVSIAIKDQGLGIPEDELTHVFERYFRAKTAEGIMGTGLGLSVSKEFVEMHGGSIEVTSVEGEGSTFTVRLPIASSIKK